MRDLDEQRIALECLVLAHGDIADAMAFLAFVTGTDEDDAKAKLDAVRAAVS